MCCSYIYVCIANRKCLKDKSMSKICSRPGEAQSSSKELSRAIINLFFVFPYVGQKERLFTNAHANRRGHPRSGGAGAGACDHKPNPRGSRQCGGGAFTPYTGRVGRRKHAINPARDACDRRRIIYLIATKKHIDGTR